MIETIYSNENGSSDNIRKTQATLKMPKNIRQVGKINVSRKIYIEDYVMSFIKQLAAEEYSECNIAVLVGQCVMLDNGRCIFISGAVKVNDADAVRDITFTNDTWTSIYEDIKKYFVDLEIVGWIIGGPGYLLAEEDKIQKTHINNFAGQDKVLLTYDNLEKDVTFLCYENNRLCKQDGYYIYYDKNEEMQTYIIDHKNGGSCEENYEDKVSKDIRSVVQDKKTVEEDSKGVTRLMYAAGTLLAVIVLIIGAAMLRNYEQMKSMQDTLNHLSKNVQNNLAGNNSSEQSAKSGQDDNKVTAAATKAADKETSADKKEQDNLDVEVERGNVNPIKKSSADSGKKDVTDKGNDKEAVSDKELASDKNTSKSTTKNTAKNTTKKASSSKSNTSSKSAAKKATVNAFTYYTVKSGDTLADISYKLYNTYTKVKKIMELNGITDQDLIYEGQKLKVPK